MYSSSRSAMRRIDHVALSVMKRARISLGEICATTVSTFEAM